MLASLMRSTTFSPLPNPLRNCGFLVSGAAFEVGYASPNQFSREYVSCGDQGADEEWGMNSDARRPSDAARGCQALSQQALSCNTVTQAGCEAGEKCALLVESDEPARRVLLSWQGGCVYRV